MNTFLRNLVAAVCERRTMFTTQPAMVMDQRGRRREKSPRLRVPPHSRFILLGALGVMAATPSSFAVTTWNGPSITVSTVIPDNNDVGLTSTQTVGSTGITEIGSVTVTIHLTGGWNGDLYAYLVHDTGFSVLLNRPGRSLTAPDGSASSGMVITFDDSATSDIHTAIPMSGGSVSGTWQPDGRISDPLVVLDTSPRSAMLGNFIGLDPAGNWTLFIADQSAGETSTLQSWSMTITGVPEPSAVLVAALGLLPLFRRKRVLGL